MSPLPVWCVSTSRPSQCKALMISGMVLMQTLNRAIRRLSRGGEHRVHYSWESRLAARNRETRHLSFARKIRGMPARVCTKEAHHTHTHTHTVYTHTHTHSIYIQYTHTVYTHTHTHKQTVYTYNTHIQYIYIQTHYPIFST